MKFEELGLSENILKAINDCGYDTPTPIQAQAIPHVLMGRDVTGLAQTGTGKTASFTLPMIEMLQGGRVRARMPRSLVLAPTRELAAQVAENFETYGKYTKLEKALLTGGVSMGPQIEKLDRGVDVLIATPGRLLDLFERGKILLTGIQILVIDEADRMMDMGFIPDIEKIVSFLSPVRQTLLFSATMPPEIQKLTKKFQISPKEVAVAQKSSTAKTVDAFIVKTTPRNKKQTLLKLLKKEKVSSAFIFCNRKRDISGVKSFLQDAGYNAEEMHGDMDQKHRSKTLEAFKNGDIELLVCSDVAGRGIDVDDLSHVFNYDVPFNADDYVHRIGRTGRAGKEGRAFTLVTSADDKFLDAVQTLIQKDIEEFSLDTKGTKDSQKSSKAKPGRNSKSSNAKTSSAKSSKDKVANLDDRRHKSAKSSAPAKEKSRREDDEEDNETLGFGDEIPAFFG